MCTTIHAQEERIPSKCFALFSKDGDFQNYDFSRHAVGDHDILISTMYCGICHSDIHEVNGDWKEEQYPLVPGHEIVGEVVAVGKDVTKFHVGDYAGVGCMVNSCRHCEYCEEGQEQYCLNGRVLTYADKDVYHGGEMTQGGYSSNMVVDEAFAITLPKDAPLEKIGPLMCAGGSTRIDMTRAMEILHDEFGVKRLAIVGGGHICGGFLEAGLVDEVSVIIAPGIDGRTGQPAMFDGIADSGSTPYKLKSRASERRAKRRMS